MKAVYGFNQFTDSEAFVASLVASGGIEKTGYSDDAFRLADAGRKALFILAGNHDVRILLGMRAVNQPRNPRNEHFFIRMGAKAVPFLVEIHNQYLVGREALRGIPGTSECRRRLYPSERWFDLFPELARKIMQEQTLERELIRIRWKIEHFEEDCDAAGLTLRHAYAAALKWQSLFLRPEGEFYWFFRKMQLACQEGSFLWKVKPSIYTMDPLPIASVQNTGKWIYHLPDKGWPLYTTRVSKSWCTATAMSCKGSTWYIDRGCPGQGIQ